MLQLFKRLFGRPEVAKATETTYTLPTGRYTSAQHTVATGCPKCGNSEFFPGPTGGMSVNIKCTKCGTKWCWDSIFGFQDKPIDNSDELYNRARPLDLRKELSK